MKNIFDLFFYSKPVFFAGPEKPGGGEKIPQREVKQLDNKFNRITKNLDRIKKRNVKSILNRELKSGLRDQVVDAIKKKLDPYNPQNAEALLKVTYSKSQIDSIVRKASRKVNANKFNINRQNVENIKLGSKTRFADIVKQNCGVKENETDISVSLQGKPWENLASKIAKSPSADPKKLRGVAANARKFAKQAITQATKSEFGEALKRQVNDVVKRVS
jgi:hypothetical protein